MKPSTLESAREFLAAGGRIAVVGVSRDPKDFSRYVLRELAARGLDIVAVNPALTEADGRPCFARVGDVSPPARAALVMTSPAHTDDVVRECLAAGVSRIWLHRGAGAGSATPTALALCAERGVEPVHDLCPFMALPGASFPHRLHHAFRRLLARA